MPGDPAIALVGEPHPFRHQLLPPPDGETVVRYLFVGRELTVAFVDRSVEALWGVTAAQLRDQPDLWLAHVHVEDRAAVAAALEKPSGSRWSLEYRVVRGDGRVAWVHDQGVALHYGGRRQVSGRVVDVTRQRLLAERLRFQAQLLEAVGQAVMATDCAGAVTYWNPAAERLYGWTAEEAMGQSVLELTEAPGRRAEMARILAGVFARGESWSGDLPVRRRGGREIPAIVTLTPLTGTHGEVVGMVAVSLDVSAAHEAELRIRDSEAHARRLVEQLRRLTSHLQVVREQEQARIAREIHDELGQMLTGLKLDVEWLQRRAAGSAGELPPQRLRERLAGLGQLVDQTLDAVRNIARQLRPPALDDLGLETAIEWLVEEFRTRTGIPCELRCDLDGLPTDGGRDTAAFRILQEALTNVARHAAASRARVDVGYGRGNLSIDLRDDGKGVPATALRSSGSLGLVGMRERARACGGDLTVRRLRRGGTQVRARLPVITPAAPETTFAAATETEAP